MTKIEEAIERAEMAYNRLELMEVRLRNMNKFLDTMATIECDQNADIFNMKKNIAKLFEKTHKDKVIYDLIDGIEKMLVEESTHLGKIIGGLREEIGLVKMMRLIDDGEIHDLKLRLEKLEYKDDNK